MLIAFLPMDLEIKKKSIIKKLLLILLTEIERLHFSLCVAKVLGSVMIFKYEFLNTTSY